MMDDLYYKINHLLIVFIPMILGTTLHELAHAYAAWKLGDPTAKNAGRLTLNPIAHLDPAGSLVFLLTSLMGPFALGWAKPVPINPWYFKDRHMGEIIVSVAGPLANFFVAFVFALIYDKAMPYMIVNIPGEYLKYVLSILEFGIVINITLGWFNLLPIPPLDGSHILGNLFPRVVGGFYDSLGRYSFILVVILMASGVFGKILRPLINFTMDIFYIILG